MKLSAGEIDLLQHAIAAAGRDWKPAAQLAFRGVVLARAQQFLSSGYGGSAAYDDHRPSVRPETEFLALMVSVAAAVLGESRE